MKGSIVTIDAAGCQKNIVTQIREQEGDYLLAVKINQPNLYKSEPGKRGKTRRVSYTFFPLAYVYTESQVEKRDKDKA